MNVDVDVLKFKDASSRHHATEAKEQMEKKLKEVKNWEILKTKCISDGRLTFRIRTSMVELKANMKGMYKNGDYSCLGCGDKDAIEDQGVQPWLTQDKN
jgi:hypothetical protein